MANSTISVIISMYNVEKYVEECLDSLHAQTFQDFEVIVVDDCSTDDSFKVVESYAPKFNGRLRLTKTEKNSGGGGEPRNIGLNLAGGEYIFFVDADDFIMLNTLETLYKAAREYTADVVYYAADYDLMRPNDIYIHRDGIGKKMLKDGLIDKPDLTVDNPNKILRQLLTEEPEGNLRGPTTKFIRRSFLLENNIVFPTGIPLGEDFIWVINVYCHAKRFLRIPMPLYFYRRYNTQSVTIAKRKPREQVSHWLSSFVTWTKYLSKLACENEILRKNPAYCRAALKSHFEWSFQCIRKEREQLSSQEIYELLINELAKEDDLRDLTLPFFFSVIDANKRIQKENIIIIDDLKKSDAEYKQQVTELEYEVKLLKAKNASQNAPSVSVIVPMYNVEKYVEECLDSLLAQTFQDFEVIVVDDCSTDNSFKVVESYAPKFNGRLRLTKTEKNSGGGGEPRNIGLNLAGGKYIFFVDADDFIMLNTLETLYKVAREYTADVVYYAADYDLMRPNDIYIHRDGVGKKLLKDGLEDKPTLTIDDQDKILKELLILGEGNLHTPWSKFLRRDFLLENNIVFPEGIPQGEDFIWVINVYCHAKRFLRISTPFYFYRRYNTQSVTQTNREPTEQISYIISNFVAWLRAFKELSSKNKILRDNPNYGYLAAKSTFNYRLNLINKAREQLSNQEIYELLIDKLAKEDDLRDLTLPFFFSVIDANKRIQKENIHTTDKLKKSDAQYKKHIAELEDEVKRLKKKE